MGYQKVLMPVSGKYRLERAARALDHALQLVREDGEIGFLHCVEEMTYLITGTEQRTLVMEDTSEAEKLLGPLVARVRNAGIACGVHIVEGSPVTHIPRFAAERKFHIVVMYTDSAEPGRLAIGGIADRVFQYLNVPLLIVH